ncbi:MAG: GntR family transcriptional regulator [Phycisphaerales bacterium]|nr:GntR family transcriptional regulator [Phycisphaerales bacterium]
MSDTDMCTTGGTNGRSSRLSYKFQRLREQIRAAILNGEFQGRLPGERELGRRYNANAKTVNKALCDLSSEGLLVRHIGRGTFVATDEDAAAEQQREFYCLHFTAREEPHQEALIAKLRKSETAQGRELLEVSVPSSKASAIHLNDWKPTSRRSTDGLFFVPNGPLSRGSGHLSEELVLEAHRRHVPVVVLGACADSPKLNSVVPDYVDAGFRLSEHAYRLGCETVIAAYYRGGREVQAVLSGSRTAVTRYQGRFGEVMLDTEGGQPFTAKLESLLSEAITSPVRSRVGPVAAVVCIGSESLKAFRASETLVQRWHQGEIAVIAVLDAGDTMARDSEITSYDVDIDRIASWGTRLMADTRSGQRPVEIVIPGTLQIRNSIAPAAQPIGAAATKSALATVPSDSVTVEAMI